jgi:hypothetical protein
MRLALAIPLTLAFLAPLRAAAQPATPAAADAHDAVMAPIHALFDGMRAADSSAVRAAFHPTASLFTVRADGEGVMGVHETPLDRFAAAVAGDHEVYDERLGDAEVRVDGDLATVWVPYAFYLGDAFSHCGTNAFQLARLDGAWSILHVTDTRRPDDCDPSIEH